MKVLFIYRNPKMGFSIGKVFKPIEEEMRKYAEVDSVYLPVPDYKPIGLWKNIRAARKAVKKKNYDIIHITGAEHYLLPFLPRKKTVTTVHDLGFYTNKKRTLRAIWKYIVWIQVLKFSERITFISEKSKNECLHYIHFKAKQAFVINNPVGKEFTYFPKEFNMPQPVILHIGTKANKNLINSIKAMEGISCNLRIIGKISTDVEMLLHQLQVNYSCVYNLTDEKILAEYKNCDIVNLPSLYEGFGMPIIEGNAVGRVVVTSNLSPMKDIANDAAVIVNPTDIQSIKNGYLKAIREHDKYIKRGLENVKRFQLSDITQEYYNLYREM